MRTIAVVNQKGGCGKTTTTINLAAFLALAGRRTLIVDMDPQGHSTLGLLPGGVQSSMTMYDVFVQYENGRHTQLPDIVRPARQNLDVAPADIRLSEVPDKFAAAANGQTILADLVGEVSDRYDYVLVDCPPHVGFLTVNAISACSEAIVPVDPSFFALHGIGKLLETFDALAKTTGHEIATHALVTLYLGRSQFAREVVDEIRGHLAGRCFNTIIRHSVKLAEAASHGLPIAAYCHRCAGFEDYEALAAEVLAMETARQTGETLTVGADAAEIVRAPSAPTVTPDGVLFTLEAPGAHRVQLVGDFNGWAPDGNEMTPTGTVWTSLLKLQPGRYQYRYVIDGDWRSDPLNMEVEPSPYGGYNSVFVVADRSSSEPIDAMG
jgi:chromosome partitioning protein